MELLIEKFAEFLFELKTQFGKTPGVFNGNPLFGFEEVGVGSAHFELAFDDVVAVGFWMFADRVGNVAGHALVVNEEHSFVNQPFLERGLMGLQGGYGKITGVARGSTGVKGGGVDGACDEEKNIGPAAKRD